MSSLIPEIARHTSTSMSILVTKRHCLFAAPNLRRSGVLPALDRIRIPAFLWLRLLVLGFLMMVAQKGFAQSMTLSSPTSGSTYADNLNVLLSISGESGSISNVRLVCTYTAGPYTASIGSIWTLTMVSTSASQSFSFNPSTVTSSALFSSVSPSTAMPDGTYTIVAKYTRSTSAVVTSNTVTSVTTDTIALTPHFTYSPAVTINTGTDVISLSGTTAVGINTATDVVTLVNHGLAPNATVTIAGATPAGTYYASIIDKNSFKLTTTPGGSTFVDFTAATSTPTISPACHRLSNGDAVTVSGTDVSSTTPYYVSVIDANSFKLTTTQGGSTFVDFTTASSPTITYPDMTGDIHLIGTTTASFMYTIPEAFVGGSAKLTFIGHTTVTLTLINVVRNGRISFDRTAIAGSGIASSTSTTLPDDTYTVTLTYKDLYSHTSAPATLYYVFYDAATLPPSFTSLVNNASITDGSSIPYTLPEAPYGGTVTLTFSNATTTKVIQLPNTQSGTFTYSRALYGYTVPTGTYTVTLSYQDTAQNAVASTSVTGVAVTVAPFSTTVDTDGDGLNDAAEAALAGLGFDPQVAQPTQVTAFLNNVNLYTQAQLDAARTAGQADVTSNPTAYSLYSLTQLQNLQVGTPVITKDTTTGKWKITITLQKSTDLTTYTPFPFDPAGTSVNSSGQVEFLFTVPENNAFFRLSTTN
ncbi:MAG TPA: hypothetical protein VIM69_10110 [Opitutaceae bacterium]